MATSARAWRRAVATLLVAAAWLPGPSALAQRSAVAVEAAPAASTAAPASGAAAAPIERDSPRAALALYFDAARAGRWDDAARFLVLDDSQRPRAAQLARRLKGVIDDHHWIDLESVSGASSGRLDDELPRDIEEIERIRVDGREESLRMMRVFDERGSHWAFSPATVGRIDTWYAGLPDRWMRDAIVYTGTDALLLRAGPLELLWWQWIAAPVLALVSAFAGALLGRATRRLLRRIVTATAMIWTEPVVDRLGPPLCLVWALNVFWFGAGYLVLTEPAYARLHSLTTAGIVFGLFWALWRCCGAIVERLAVRPWAVRSASARTLVTVGGNFLRSAIFCVGGLAVLAAAGYPVGTLLAGLGIGGLAIAFGAQKTIENVFGSLSLAIDQPFRVGDFVKVDEFVATVEDIGLRSTRFRTLDRTLISIPNGKLAEQRLESYEARDRMRLAATLAIDYGTTRRQMQAVLDGFERVLRDHPKLWPDALVVKFAGFGDNALQVEIMAWFDVPTWSDFQVCRQDVLLGFMQVVEDAGTRFALPTRQVHLATQRTSPRPPPTAPTASDP